MRTAVTIALAMATSGCRFFLGDADNPGAAADAQAEDAAMSLVDAKPVDRCGWGAGVISANGLCVDALPTSSLTLGDINTDTGPCVPYTDLTGAYCVLAGTTVAGGARVTGSKPLIVIATEQLTITGTLDAAARLAENQPAPGGEIMCSAVTPPTSATYGGAGGSFGGRGGRGGIPNQVNENNRAAPGEPIMLTRPTALRGGCKGSTTNSTTGRAGYGGGALYLISAVEVRVEGTVNASGAGGGGGTDDRGGGGAGSGGMIILDAPVVRIQGQLHADGGGGGEGGGNGQTGQNGVDGGGTSAALGGFVESGTGGDGGNGSYVPSADGLQGQKDLNSGGAGGGGTGMIWVRAMQPAFNGIISPSPTLI